MATPVAIPPEDSVYSCILNALNEQRYDYVIKMYEILTYDEHHTFSRRYPEIYLMLNEVYMREKVKTAAKMYQFS